MPFHAAEIRHIPQCSILSFFFDHCLYDDPDRPIFTSAIDPNKSLSWRQTRNYVRRLIAGFRKQGLQNGECVYVLAPNSIFYWPTCLAIIGAGGILCAGSVMITPDETAGVVEKVQARWMVVHEMYMQHAQKCLGANGTMKMLRFDNDGSSLSNGTRNGMHEDDTANEGGIVPLSHLLEHGEADWKDLSAEEARSTIAWRSFTSGTSGPSKVPELSHAALVAPGNTVWELWEVPGMPSAQNRILHFVGLSHISGFMLFTGCLVRGYSSHILQFTGLPSFLRTCKAVQPTNIMLPPSLAVAISQILSPGDDSLRSVRKYIMPGMSLPVEARKKFLAAIGNDPVIIKPYGNTELNIITGKTDSNKHPDSVGPLMANMSIKLIDPTDPTLPELTARNTPGEICAAGPTLLSSYFSATGPPISLPVLPPTELHSKEPRYFRTGDIGFIDDNDEWHIVGRVSDNFKVAYEHVNVEDLGEVLAAHPSVREAAVAKVMVEGKVDPLIRGFVVLKDGKGVVDGEKEVREREIVEWVNGRVAVHRRITGGVRFLEAIPRNAMGKILRWQLDVTT